jgi:hypothetical protein
MDRADAVRHATTAAVSNGGADVDGRLAWERPLSDAAATAAAVGLAAGRACCPA